MVIMQIPQSGCSISSLKFYLEFNEIRKTSSKFFVTTETFLGCCAIFHSDSNNC